MKLPSSFPRLKGFRFPREIVAYAVWVYQYSLRFNKLIANVDVAAHNHEAAVTEAHADANLHLQDR